MQLQPHQSAVSHDQHDQQCGNQQNEKPVDFEKDALIDTGASFSSLMNAQPLDNVVVAEEPIAVYVNAGNKTLQEQGELAGFKAEMWKDTTGRSNVLSFAKLADQCHMTCDNAVEDAFHVKEWDNCNEGIKFDQNHLSNLCHFKFSDNHINQDKQNDVQPVETVAENFQNHGTEQCERTRVAMRLHHALGAPRLDKLHVTNKTNWIKKLILSHWMAQREHSMHLAKTWPV